MKKHTEDFKRETVRIALTSGLIFSEEAEAVSLNRIGQIGEPLALGLALFRNDGKRPASVALQHESVAVMDLR